MVQKVKKGSQGESLKKLPANLKTSAKKKMKSKNKDGVSAKGKVKPKKGFQKAKKMSDSGPKLAKTKKISTKAKSKGAPVKSKAKIPKSKTVAVASSKKKITKTGKLRDGKKGTVKKSLLKKRRDKECSICGEPRKDGVRVLPCSFCRRIYHSRCYRLKYGRLRATGTHGWRCAFCAKFSKKAMKATEKAVVKKKIKVGKSIEAVSGGKKVATKKRKRDVDDDRKPLKISNTTLAQAGLRMAWPPLDLSDVTTDAAQDGEEFVDNDAKEIADVPGFQAVTYPDGGSDVKKSHRSRAAKQRRLLREKWLSYVRRQAVNRSEKRSSMLLKIGLERTHQMKEFLERLIILGFKQPPQVQGQKARTLDADRDNDIRLAILIKGLTSLQKLINMAHEEIVLTGGEEATKMKQGLEEKKRDWNSVQEQKKIKAAVQQRGTKARPKGRLYSVDQLQLLESWYSRSAYPEPAEFVKMCAKLNGKRYWTDGKPRERIQVKQLRIWFENKRTKDCAERANRAVDKLASEEMTEAMIDKLRRKTIKERRAELLRLSATYREGRSGFISGLEDSDGDAVQDEYAEEATSDTAAPKKKKKKLAVEKIDETEGPMSVSKAAMTIMSDGGSSSIYSDQQEQLLERWYNSSQKPSSSDMKKILSELKRSARRNKMQTPFKVDIGLLKMWFMRRRYLQLINKGWSEAELMKLEEEFQKNSDPTGLQCARIIKSLNKLDKRLRGEKASSLGYRRVLRWMEKRRNIRKMKEREYIKHKEGSSKQKKAKVKGKSNTFTPPQTKFLEAKFAENDQPDRATAEKIVETLNGPELAEPSQQPSGITLRQVRMWFAGRQRRDSRVVFSSEQQAVLEKWFLKLENPSKSELEVICNEVNDPTNLGSAKAASETAVRRWFSLRYTEKESQGVKKEPTPNVNDEPASLSIVE